MYSCGVCAVLLEWGSVWPAKPGSLPELTPADRYSGMWRDWSLPFVLSAGVWEEQARGMRGCGFRGHWATVSSALCDLGQVFWPCWSSVSDTKWGWWCRLPTELPKWTDPDGTVRITEADDSVCGFYLHCFIIYFIAAVIFSKSGSECYPSVV